MDIDKLTNALNNDMNESIMGLTSRKILELNLKIIKELHLDRETTLLYLKKLKDYRYVDEICDLKYGAFIKWIPITDPTNIPLNYAGIVCDIKLTNTGTLITCKNFMHRHYTFNMEECLIFQKLSAQEKVLLSALDHLANEVPSKNEVPGKHDVKVSNQQFDSEDDDDYSDDSD